MMAYNGICMRAASDQKWLMWLDGDDDNDGLNGGLVVVMVDVDDVSIV